MVGKNSPMNKKLYFRHKEIYFWELTLVTTVITKCSGYYKMLPFSLKFGTVITKCVGTLLEEQVIFVITVNHSFLLISSGKVEYALILFLL